MGLQTEEIYGADHSVLLAEIQRLANLGCWEWDVRSNKVTWSRELYSIYGIEKDKFKASFEGYLEKLHPDDKSRVMSIINNALKNKHEVNFYERIVRPDGGVRYLKSWGSVDTDESGEVTKMFGVCLDVTESKLQEITLQAREEELEMRIRDRTRELEKQYKIIQNQKVAIEKMFRETHHRVKNNMQIISSLLRLQSNLTDDPDVLAMFDDCQSRIQTMGLIHEKMYKTSLPETVDSNAHLTELVIDIILSSKLTNSIERELEIESMPLHAGMLVPLGMIINEVIVNSIKHAFKDGDNATIYFEFKSGNDGKYHMTIGDNGETENTDYLREGSLGMELIQTFVEQLDGKVERFFDGGTVYKFEFKKPVGQT